MTVSGLTQIVDELLFFQTCFSSPIFQSYIFVSLDRQKPELQSYETDTD